MISILCDKHKQEIADRVESSGLPAQISNETHGHLSDSELDSILVEWTKVSRDVDTDNCPNCKLVGLSKRGYIEELDSPNDWFMS